MKKKMLVLMGVIACLSCSVITNAETRSSQDTEFNHFSISPSDYNKLGYRKKDNSTPVYLYYQSATNNRFEHIFVRAYGTGDANLTLNGNAKSVDHVTCSMGHKYAIRSNIHEFGHGLATLGFLSANYIESQKISGYWSPDSVGTYPYAY